MLIRIGYDIIFNLPAATPMNLMLYVHPSRGQTLLNPENVSIEPWVPVQFYTDDFDNTVGRIIATAGQVRFRNDVIVQDNGLPDEADPTARQHSIDELPTDVLPFLLSSRYCEADLLKNVAGNLFMSAQPGWPRAAAVCEWVHHNVRFGYEFARTTKTAAEVYQERAGVGRDFTHLAIAFCRALNIPARYATGYLGDIGVPPSPSPMDFSPWYEVYLGGRWWTMDARYNEHRIGRVLMARGRDAVDVALTTAFGKAELQQFIVRTEELKYY